MALLNRFPFVGSSDLPPILEPPRAPPATAAAQLTQILPELMAQAPLAASNLMQQQMNLSQPPVAPLSTVTASLTSPTQVDPIQVGWFYYSRFLSACIIL